MYKVSYNKPNNKCIIHKKSCNSLHQVIGDKASDYQKYSEILNTYEDAILFCTNADFENYRACQKCLPDCEN